MGCQESKAVKVAPFNPANNRLTRASSGKIDLTKSAQDDDPCVNDIGDYSENKRRRKTRSGKRSLGSNGSLIEASEESDRGGSASSKISKESGDSGLGLAEDYSFVITENSDPNTVRQIEEGFESRESLELGVVGTACTRRQSAREKRHEELVILEALREEGLISLPKAKSSGGMSFEVIMDTPDIALRRPARLAKLDKKKKKKKVLTEEQIKEKLERADRRRKEREQSKLEKIKEWELKHEHMTATTDVVEKVQKEKEIHQKIEHVTDNREKKLQEIQEKIRKREEHAEKVRQRKLAAAAAAAVAETEETEEAVPASHGIVRVQPMEETETEREIVSRGIVQVQPMEEQTS